MEDKLFFGSLVYLTIVLVAFSILPSSFISGQPKVFLDSTDILSEQPEDITSLDTNLNFIAKIGILFFATFSITGIPTIFGLLIVSLNLFVSIIFILSVYDKIRGI